MIWLNVVVRPGDVRILVNLAFVGTIIQETDGTSTIVLQNGEHLETWASYADISAKLSGNNLAAN